MKAVCAALLLLGSLFCSSCRGQGRPPAAAVAPVTFRFQQAVILLADSADAAAALSVGDAYTAAFTPFDLQGRLGRSDDGGHEADYLKMAAQQCRNWSPANEEALKKSFGSIEAWLTQNNVRLKLPDTVRVINSTCEEELGSDGYTRRNNIIMNGGTDLHLVSHELFHVLSRYNPQLRDRLYAIIGFSKCPPISYQAAFGGLSLTNPDCPVVEHYTVTSVRGPQDGAGISGKAVLVLYSTRPYAGGHVFGSYLKIGLLAVEGAADKGLRPVMEDGKPRVLELDRHTMPLAVKQLGVNTPYLLHPEEISAEHFSQLIAGEPVDHPEKLQAMRRVLQGK